MKTSVIAAIFAVANGVLATTATQPMLNEKDMAVMQTMQALRGHLHLSEKDTQTFNTIMKNWEKLQAGKPNNFNEKDVVTFMNSMPEMEVRAITGMKTPMQKRREAMYNTKMHEARDNAYMDGELYPLRRRDNTHGTKYNEKMPMITERRVGDYKLTTRMEHKNKNVERMEHDNKHVERMEHDNKHVERMEHPKMEGKWYEHLTERDMQNVADFMKMMPVEKRDLDHKMEFPTREEMTEAFRAMEARDTKHTHMERMEHANKHVERMEQPKMQGKWYEHLTERDMQNLAEFNEKMPVEKREVAFGQKRPLQTREEVVEAMKAMEAKHLDTRNHHPGHMETRENHGKHMEARTHEQHHHEQ